MSELKKRLKILLAEDSLISRKLAVKMIEHCGHEADSAENGRQVVEKACSGSYDLILMDMFMPELDGGDAALEIIAKGCTSPIIALSGDILNRTDLDRYGMKDSILKPLSEKELSRVIASYCSSSLQAVRPPPVSGTSAPQEIFDEKAALEFSGGDKTVLAEMLSLYAEATGKNIERLIAEIGTGDMQKVKSIAHLIKGESKSLGILKVFAKASELNEAAKSADRESCSKLAIELKSVFHEFMGTIGKGGT